MPKLSNLISLSEGFNTSVNVLTDLGNDRKVSAYIPTNVASEVLSDVADNLHVSGSRRARLVMGTYGTGKSHLALVLARLYAEGSDVPCLQPIFEKMKGRWPGQTEHLIQERKKVPEKYLLVLIEGDQWEGTFDDVLLHRLDVALSDAGLADLLPETAFHAAIRRIKEVREKHKDHYARFGEVTRECGLPSVEALESKLAELQSGAYKSFCEIHYKTFAGARFHHTHLMEPKEVYASVAKQLVEDKGYAGIAVIWDEFGRYLERVVEDPQGPEGQSIQSFAERCNNSHENQIHLYLICHRSLQEYVQMSMTARMSGMAEAQSQEWNKISGRFHEFLMRPSDTETFNLIDQVVVQKNSDPEWTECMNAWKDRLDEWTDVAARMKLFPTMTRGGIHEHVTVGAFPLHPMAAFCLPRISQRVAQNERTMFKFLSRSGEDTLGPFLEETEYSPSDYPPCFTADQLWDFFGQDAEKHSSYKRLWSKFNQASTVIGPDDTLGIRTIKAVALLQIIASNAAPCTEAVLAFALGIRPTERDAFRERLKTLCMKEGNRDRVLIQTMNDGAYRFTGAGQGTELEARIEDTMKERLKLVSPARHLQTLVQDLELPAEIPATGYSDDFMLERKLSAEFVGVDQLKNPARWLSEIDGPPFRDGFALFVLCDDMSQAREAQALACDSLKHSQILLAIPRDPDTRLSALIRRHEALCHLRASQPHLYGEGADLYEEWHLHSLDVLETIGSIIKPMVDPEKRLLSWYTDGEEIQGITTRGRLTEAASEMMRRAFPLTPRISHARLTSEEGRDNFVNTRKSIVDKLLQRDGADLLARETSNQHKNVINNVYVHNGILLRAPNGARLAVPDAETHEAMSAIWKVVENFVSRAKHQSPAPQSMADLVATLKRSPYGLRSRTIPLIVAAVFRDYVLRGNLSFVKRGRPVNQLNGGVIDDALINPQDHELVFTSIGESHRAILKGLATAFDVEYDEENEMAMVDRIHRTIGRWWRELPPFTHQTNQVSRQTAKVRDHILKSLADDRADARRILLDELPANMGTRDGVMTLSWSAVADLFAGAKRELEGVVENILARRLVETVSSVFPMGNGSPDPEADPCLGPQKWFDGLTEERKKTRIAGDASTLVQVFSRAFESPEQYSGAVGQLAEKITGAPLKNWSDDMLGRFAGRLESAKHAVEVASINPPSPIGPDPGGYIPPAPPPGAVSITLVDEDGTFQRNFVPVNEMSPSGQNLQSIIQGAVQGMGRSLPAGECETILVGILREMLK